MADNRIEIEILLDDGKVAKGFADIESSAKKSGQKAGDNFNTGMSSSLAGLKRLALGVAAAFAGAFAVKASVAAAAEQEQAIRSLNVALASAGRYSKEASEEFQNFASTLQSTVGIADEQALNLLKLATNFARTNDEAKKLTQAALDLSAATGIDAETAVRGLGGSLSGVSGQLARLVPQVRGLTEEQLKAGEAIRIVGARFEGVAGSQTNTFSGSLLKLKNSFGEIVEAIGNVIVKSPSLVAVFNFLAGSVIKLSELIVRLSKSGDFFAPILNGLNLLIKGFGVLIGLIEVGIRFLGDFFAQLFTGFSKLAEVISSVLPDISGIMPTELFQNLKDSVTGFISDNFDDLTVAQGIFDFSEGLQRSLDTATAVMPALVNTVGSGVKEISNQTKVAEFDLKTRLGNGISSVIQSSISALAKGKNAFAAFGKAVLGVFGDLAIQLGTFFIIEGRAVDALKAINGSGAVAAGVALIALGTLIKGFAGGEGSIAGGASGTPGVSGTPQDTTSSPEISGEESLQRGNNVVVNVEGQILDPVGTATRIAELLADISGSNDIVVRT